MPSNSYKPMNLTREFEQLRSRLQRNPRDVATLNSMGIIYARMGQLQDAITLWKRGMAINPRYVHLYNNMGSALKSLGRYDEAIVVFRMGLANMHPMHQQAILWGLALGAVMVTLEQLLPKAKNYLPSATGIGLGLILPFQYPFSMLLGAIAASLWTSTGKKSAEAYLVPVAAGVIAGVSIMGVLVAVLNTILQ